jgi:hypothetical protein
MRQAPKLAMARLTLLGKILTLSTIGPAEKRQETVGDDIPDPLTLVWATTCESIETSPLVIVTSWVSRIEHP